MTTLMKQRRQIRALARLHTNPYEKLGNFPTKEAIAKAQRLGQEREALIHIYQKTNVHDLENRLHRTV